MTLDKIWHLYIVETSAGKLYTGVTTDVNRRFAEHQANSTKTARSLRGKGPLTLRFHQEVGNKGQALSWEYRLKRLPRGKKLALIEAETTLEALMATQ